IIGAPLDRRRIGRRVSTRLPCDRQDQGDQQQGWETDGEARHAAAAIIACRLAANQACVTPFTRPAQGDTSTPLLKPQVPECPSKRHFASIAAAASASTAAISKPRAISAGCWRQNAFA